MRIQIFEKKSRKLSRLTIVFCLIALTVSCGSHGQFSQTLDSPKTVNAEPFKTNILSGTSDGFNAEIDYFPDKSSFTFSKQLEVSYHNNYKLVRFHSNIGSDEMNYVLVQRGTPVPQIPETQDPRTMIVSVPVEKFTLGSFRYGGAADLFGVVDRLVAAPGFNTITTPAILAGFENGTIKQNYSEELLIDLKTEIVMDVFIFNSQLLKEKHRREIGLMTIGMAEPLEESPLAKTEWIKFFAMFFNREQQANQYFVKVKNDYETLAAQINQRLQNKIRPRVMVNSFDGDAWHVYGERNAFARLIADAGGDYFWSDGLEKHDAIWDVPYEAAYDRAANADVWIVGPDYSTRFGNGDPLFDNRLLALPPAQNNRFFVTYKPDAGGRNPFWDTALINPQLELADYVKAIHPEIADEILPNHEFVYLCRLEKKSK